MTNISGLDATVRIFDLDLTAPLQELIDRTKKSDAAPNKKGEIPQNEQTVVHAVNEPISGSLTANIVDVLAARANNVEKESLFLPHEITLFSGGENKIEFGDTVDGYDVFLVLDVPQIDERKVTTAEFRMASALLLNNYIELTKQAAEAARHGGYANSVHLIMGEHAYDRQDQRHGKTGPITAAIIARDIATYFDSITSIHLHSAPIEGIYSALRTRFRNISPHQIHTPGFICRDPDTLEPIAPQAVTLEGSIKLFNRSCIVSPDAGGAKPAQAFAKANKNLAAALIAQNCPGVSYRQAFATLPDIPRIIVNKQREKANESEVESVLGVEFARGKDCVLFDDKGDTLGTLNKAANALLKAGAASVEANLTHGIFSGTATHVLNNTGIRRFNVTDTRRMRPAVREHAKVNILGVAPVFAQAIIDTVTRPQPNISFAARHTHDAAFRQQAGRFTGPMLDILQKN